MPESMNVLFATATWHEVAAWLDKQLHSSVNNTWSLPSDDYAVLIYAWQNIDQDLEPEELANIAEYLGAVPQTGLMLELRRSKGDLAVQLAVKLIHRLLTVFPGIYCDESGAFQLPAR